MTPEERAARLDAIHERLAKLPEPDVGEALSVGMSGAGIAVERLALCLDALTLAVDEINERVTRLEQHDA